MLTATVSPANATNKNVTWSSDNTSVATVTDGKVEIKEVGVANIKVSTKDGNHTATYKVIVKEKAIVVITASLGQAMSD